MGTVYPLHLIHSNENQAKMYQEYGEHLLLVLHAFFLKSMQLGEEGVHKCEK